MSPRAEQEKPTGEKRPPVPGPSSARHKLRLLGLLATALLPGPLKRWVYRTCFRYRISPRARVGVAILDCRELVLEEDAAVAHGAAILQCGRVRLGRHAYVGPLNLVRGAAVVEMDDYSQLLRMNVVNAIIGNDCTNDPYPAFYLGYGSVVTAEHRLDITDTVRIGRRSILGGRNSSIWTHNIRSGHGVRIGDYCYVGSEIRMAPGSAIPDFTVVGLASVVVEPLREPYTLVAGVPARSRRRLTEADHEYIFGRTRRDLPDEPLPAVPAAVEAGA